TGSELEVRFQSEEEESDPLDNEKSEKAPQTSTPKTTRNMLNPKYTFDSFVVGAANRFAHAACLAVAEAPAKSYNPLFMYGRFGLGETHLMHVIDHFVKKYHPDLNVIYLSSEKFTNKFINSIMDNKADYFRNKYRNVDI